MIPALLAMAGVWLVAGWWAYQTSRRSARLWAAAALTALAAANVFTIMRSPGPWWPLIDRGWNLADWFAVPLWIAALVLILLARERGHAWGMAILACGLACFGFGMVAALSGHSSHSGRLCLGQTGSIGPWTTTLRHINPVADSEYTGVGARLVIRSGDGKDFELRPEQRDYLDGRHSPRAGSDLLLRWNGELLAGLHSLRTSRDCASIKLEWRSFAQWLGYGAWLSLAGALLLLAVACRNRWRRAAAWERIAMRRSDRRTRAVTVTYRRLAWQPLAIALAFGLACLAWEAGQSPPHDSGQRVAANGAAMIAARQSLFGGPHLTNRWLVTADALARHGQFGDAAGMLLGAVEKEPGNAEAWLALGDALYGHAGGSMVAAAALAYGRADRVAGKDASSDSLVARAMAHSGRGEAAQDWVCREHLPDQRCPS